VGDDVQVTVAELRDGRPVAYPSEAFNRTDEADLGLPHLGLTQHFFEFIVEFSE
jgi:hypothetical protein